ncbi:MAG: sulfatase-like hydrolase/transferase [Bacteroidales bacterium]|nr:sulfatase-like hydrolase/transferase [Bacteroidales bacterium]
MRTKLTILILILFLASCSLLRNEGIENPNVIFIMVDDFGYSQIAYNSEGISEKDYDPLFLQYTLENGDYSPKQALEFSKIATPTLSRMAKEGVMFTNAFAPSNLCSPSRLAIATGVQPSHWGIYRNIDSEAHGPEPGSLLVEKLHNAGYTTAHIGKWHIGSRDQSMVPEFMKKHGLKDSAGIYPSIYKYPKIQKDLNENGYMGSTTQKHHALNNGFDYYYGYNMWESPFYNATNVWNGFEHAGKNPKYNTDVFTDLAIDFIDKRVEKEQPFYVQLHFHAVHAPLHPKAPDKYYNKFDSKSFILNNFYAHVLAVDENVRRLENYLKEKGLAENTIIVFTSDNGGSIGRRSTMPGNAPFRGHKGMHLMGGIKVPLFFYWPKGIKTPEKNDQLVSALDILPTVLDATGINPPEEIDGKSLLPYLKNKSINPVHDYLVWSGIHARTWGFMKQYNIYPEVPSRNMAPYAWVVVKDGYSLRYVGETRKGHYKDIPEGKSAYYEMYNINVDPGERNDLLNTKPKIFEELKAIWEKEAKEFPPPYKIGKDKWEQIIPAGNKYLEN